MGLQGCWRRLDAEFPRFAATGTPMAFSDYLGSLDQWLAATREQFPMEPASHLWLYSFAGGVLEPACTVMAEYETVPSLDLASGTVFQRGMWAGYRTDAEAGSLAAAGAGWARSVGRIIDALDDPRPQALWMLAADGLVQAAVQSANVAFEDGEALATELFAGFAGVHPLAAGLPAFSHRGDTVRAARRSCCMIFRAGAEYCSLCPKARAAHGPND